MPLPDLKEKPTGEGKAKGFLLRAPFKHFIRQVRILIRKTKLSRCERTEMNWLIQCPV